MSYFRVTLMDEAPAIGSGRRTVFVHSVGPKWVRIRCPYTLRPASLKRADWNRILRTAKEIGQPRHIKPRITKYLKSTGQKRTAAIRELYSHPGRIAA